MIHAIVAVSVRRPWMLVLSVLALTAIAGWFAASHFAMTTDTRALISPKVAWRVNEAAVNTAFPQQVDTTLVVIDGRTPELAEAAAAKLSERLAADKAHFRPVKRPDGGPWLAEHGLLLTPLSDVQSTTQSL
ncbi:MAG: hopanoid biosynthesis-associated RND transporter HpnN, partial [Sphingomonas sp.]|nr:hopanoid biosynthesis-associated RND transporter HpnN [Sphingomonas sp.]